MNLHYVKEFRWSNRVEKRPLIKTMKEHMFGYAFQEDITHNLVSLVLFTVTATEESIYSDNEG